MQIPDQWLPLCVRAPTNHPASPSAVSGLPSDTTRHEGDDFARLPTSPLGYRPFFVMNLPIASIARARRAADSRNGNVGNLEQGSPSRGTTHVAATVAAAMFRVVVRGVVRHVGDEADRAQGIHSRGDATAVAWPGSGLRGVRRSRIRDVHREHVSQTMER